MFSTGNQDRLMEAYKEDGMFPASPPAGSEKYFKGPIRCHYKPRSVAPSLVYAAWVYFTWPLIFNTLKVAFGTGLMGLTVGLAIFGISTSCFIFI